MQEDSPFLKFLPPAFSLSHTQRETTVFSSMNIRIEAILDLAVPTKDSLRDGSQIIISESEIFDVREGEEFLAAKAMVTLMAVPKGELVSKR